MFKTFKYRLYPTFDQERTLSDVCFLCSLVYNRCLAERIQVYKQTGKSPSCYDQIKSLPGWKKDMPRLEAAHSQVLQDAVRRLDRSYQAFFRRVAEGVAKPGFPRFKSARRYDSFTYPQSGFAVLKDGRGGRLRLSKIGTVRVLMHRPLQGSVKTLTIRRKADRWYACFTCEVEHVPLPKTGRVVGVDLGITNLAVTSDGEFYPPSKRLRSSERKLKQLQRAVSRKTKGSRRRQKAIRQLQRAHEHVADQRRDQAWKAVHRLLREYDAVAVEDLQIAGMLHNRYLAKSIADASWGVFLAILEAKAHEWERDVVKVDPRNTSQLCSGCGALAPKTLAQRRHVCGQCGLDLHRDVNAAVNILKRSGLDGAFADSLATAAG